MGAMALGFSQASLASYSGIIALCGTLFYILSFGLGVGPVPGLLVPEIAPAEIRGVPSSPTALHACFGFQVVPFLLP